eukprot:6307329-Prymnesium_polylepis.1
MERKGTFWKGGVRGPWNESAARARSHHLAPEPVPFRGLEAPTPNRTDQLHAAPRARRPPRATPHILDTVIPPAVVVVAAAEPLAAAPFCCRRRHAKNAPIPTSGTRTPATTATTITPPPPP